MGLRLATERFFDDFHGYVNPAALGAGNTGRWTLADTSSAGAPTMLTASAVGAGAMKLLVAADSEAENLCLYWGDILSLKIDDLISFATRVKVLTADITTAEEFTFGLTSARNSTTDSTTYNSQFKLAASNAVVLETDDNATDADDKVSGITLPFGTWKEFLIDFSNGISDVRFHGSDANGKLRRLGSQTFTMAGATGQYLQPNFQLQKASGTTTPAVLIDYVEILYRRS